MKTIDKYPGIPYLLSIIICLVITITYLRHEDDKPEEILRVNRTQETKTYSIILKDQCHFDLNEHQLDSILNQLVNDTVK